MSPEEIRGPDLAGVVADANAVGLPYVVIGGFAVIAHGYFRASAQAIDGDWRGTPFRVASLRTLVGFKRLAGRPGDRVHLEKLERANGELPEDEIPGLDS